MKGWKNTLYRARLNTGVWLEHSVEDRFKVEFRGGCLQMGDYEQGEAGAVLVNGVGDLFYTEFQRKEQGIDHFILSEQTASFQFQSQHDQVLEEWGQKVYNSTPLKTAFARQIFIEDHISRKKAYGMPKIKRVENGDLDNVSDLSIMIEPDSKKKNKNKTSIPKIEKIVEHVDQFPEDSMSQKVINILMQRGDFDDVAESNGVDEYIKEEADEVEDEPDNIKSFLDDLGCNMERWS